jgi:molybdate transport system substrate-binding protein
MSRVSAILVAAALAVLPARRADAGEVRVFAASSLTDAFQEIARAYEATHPGTTVACSFAGTQVLRTQIEQGAPADVFAAADLEPAEAMARQGFLARPAVFARNALVVVAPSRGAVREVRDLARPGVRLVIAGAEVPAGRYTDQVLDRLAVLPGYGGAFAARVRASVVSRETNVRVVLSKVLLGEADAAFVYATDAADPGDKLRVIRIPEGATVTAAYAIAVVPRPVPSPEARGFVELVTSAAGRAILGRHGFAP